MSRFVDICGNHINVDSIESYYQDRNGCLNINLAGGSTEFIPRVLAKKIMIDLAGGEHIVQIIKAKEPFIHIGKEPGEHSATVIHYLALCADGAVRAAGLHNGQFNVYPNLDDLNWKGDTTNEDEGFHAV